ncbi:hypothetical protein CASFOL_001832 [Castilleja foliolosa]|uniref:Uncharacterized protein n=1 Tax=Castilleja foliolosa TaxID=1961234 RepID=A0ABD3EG46_9LAMI
MVLGEARVQGAKGGHQWIRQAESSCRDQGAGVDELWFRVGDQFLRFFQVRVRPAHWTKVRHTDFDPNKDYSYPSDGVYKRKICRGRGGIKLNDMVERFAEGEFAVSTDDQLKISKVIFVCSVLFGEDNLKKLIRQKATLKVLKAFRLRKSTKSRVARVR